MNREIKFRAWDKKESQMVGDGLEEFSIGFDGRLRFWHRIKKDYYPLDDEFVVMQYTGLKDKNGKEIYEGDIINDYEMKYAHLGRQWVVQWVDDGWKVSVGEFHYSLKDAAHLEVIGNIYENPELLQEKTAAD